MKKTLAENNIDWFNKINELSLNVATKFGFNKSLKEKIYDELTFDYIENESFYFKNSLEEVTTRMNKIFHKILNPLIINDPTSSNYILEGNIPFKEDAGDESMGGLIGIYEAPDIFTMQNFNYLKDSNPDAREIGVNSSQIRELLKVIRTTEEFDANDGIIITNYIDFSLYQQLLNNKKLLKTMNWRAFEMLLADMLETFGYKIDLMQGTKDGGIDIIAFSKNAIFGEEKYLIQAKRYQNKVGVEPVRSLLFNQNHYKTTKSCLATTSFFTKGAWDLAELYKWQLELKDFNAITNWLKKSYELKSVLTK